MTAENLTDFLLARIAEDEEAAREWCAVLLSRELEQGSEPFDFEAVHGPGDPIRVLAECEAKRRIVEWLPEWTVLRLLALPYVGHPHYDEEWRP